jgi:stress response protein YsnF
VKKFLTIGGSLASVLLLLTLSAMPTLATTWNEPILAQSAPTNPNAPTDTPIPVRVDDRNNNLWWLLILIPVGGLVWAVSRSRRQNNAIVEPVSPPLVPSIPPVSSIDPVSLDGRAPQSDRADENSLVERDRQHVNGSTEIAPVMFSAANRTGRDREAQVTTPADYRSTQARFVTTESTFYHAEPTVGSVRDAEPDKQPAERIRLLEERLVVERHKRKVGEVIVRKEIETRHIRVPIQREILIVEQVDPEFKQLAVVDLGQVHGDSIEIADRTFAASFSSPTSAIDFLRSLAARSPHESPDLQLNIAIEGADTQEVYRQWLAQQSIEVN